jgi:hypothetical protein
MDDKYKTLRFVDEVRNINPALGNNFLFRGGMPLDSNGNFDIHGLKEAIKYIYPQAPESYYLVDISLVYEWEDGLNAERRFFNDPNNFNVGQLVWWPTDGSLRCYYRTDPAEQDRLVRTLDEWLPDTLIQRTETLRYMLETSYAPGRTPYWPGYNGGPCIFYVHCDGGCDRTGEMIGAYRLRQGYDWFQTYWEQPCGRPMGCSNYRALQWYAMWLNQTFGFNLVPYGDDGCSDPEGTWNACHP